MRSKTGLLPWLCCLAFYGGTQLTGETEAAFSSQVSLESITLSTADVVPASAREEDQTIQLQENIESQDEAIANGNQDKQVTVDEEETLEHRE